MKNFISNKNLLGISAKRIGTEKRVVYKCVYESIKTACIDKGWYNNVILFLKDVINNPFNSNDVIVATQEILKEFEELIKND